MPSGEASDLTSPLPEKAKGWIVVEEELGEVEDREEADDEA
jgi:hypothetical protein